MATTVHIPASLLAAADRRARVLKISRNRLIIRAIEHELASARPEWSPGFFEKLRPLAGADARAFARSMDAVRAQRSSKRAPKL